MHNILGIVKVVIGQVFAIAVDGTQRELHEGDRIFAGEEIVTGANGALTVNLSDGHTMDMGRNSHWSDQSGVSAAANTEHATDDVAALQQAITDGVDPTKALEATAAGNETPIEAGTGGGGHFIERVDLTGEVLDVTSGFATNSLNSQISGNREFDTFSAPIDNVQDTNTNPTLTQTVQQTPTNNAVPVGDLTPSKTVEQPLVETPHVDRPSEIPTTELMPAEVPLTTLTPTDVPQTTLTPADVPQTTLTPADVPLTTLTPADVPQTTLTPADVPQTTLTPADVPLTTLTSAEIPQTTLTPAEVPLTTLTPAEISQTTLTPADVPLTTLTPADVPLTTLTPAEIPLTTLTPAEIPQTTLTPAEIPLTTLTPADVPQTTLTSAEIPQTTLTPAEIPQTTLTPADVPLTTLTPADVPLTTLTPAEIPLTTLTPADVPQTTLTPTDVPQTTLTPADVPLTTLTPADVPQTTLTPVFVPQTELTPAKHHDHVNITIDNIVTETTPPTMELHGTITHVNGGSGSPDGFDVQDGKIVSIGSNVRIYLSKDDFEPKCDDPEHQIQHYNEGNQKGDGNYSDVFVVHPGSQYIRPADSYHDNLQSVKGDSQSGHKDYIFLQDGEGIHYKITSGVDHPENHQVNSWDNVSVTGTDGHGHTLSLNGSNQIAGVIYGDGTSPNSPESNPPQVESPASEQHSTITGTVTGDAALGDIVKLTVNDHHYKGEVVDLGNGKLGYNIGVETGDLKEGLPVHVSITIKDDLGHVTTATADKNIDHDQVPPANSSDDADTIDATHDLYPASHDHDVSATISIDQGIGDGNTNAGQLLGITTNVIGTVGGNVHVHDEVTLVVNNHTYYGYVQPMGNGQLGYSIAVTTTDLSDNQIAHASVKTADGVEAHAEYRAGLSITIDQVAGDDNINGLEGQKQTTDVTGTVSGDAKADDLVTLTINGHDYTGQVVDLGDGHLGYKIPVNTAELANGHVIHASVTAKDGVGDTEEAYTDHFVRNDTAVPVENTDNTDLAREAPPANKAVATEGAAAIDASHSPITHINGGSESADGFDVQDGKIVAIGSNVNVWLSDGDSEPNCADPQNQIKHYSNGNVNGDGSHADVFVVHEGSGYMQDGNHRGLDAINGTTQQLQGGHKDYIFIQDGKESDFEFSFSSNNNAQTNVNTLDNVTVTGTVGQELHLQGMNHLEGVIYGDGTVHTPNEGRTSISHSDAPVSEAEHSLPPAAPPVPSAEESAVHATVEHHAEQSHSLNNLLESNDDLFLPAAAPSADSALHHSVSTDLGSDQDQHVEDRINLSDLAHELEHGTDITSLIKGTEQSGSEPTVIDPKAHAAPAMMSESAGMDSLQHSSFDHLLHKPEHQY
ncbi:retention module-containing protein [Buttiauxella sp. A2-C1_F]|uniref:retention module-containing protein n=2 Tax=unclassified Buttiauxella TaxID=2634062 RepID=UPI001E4C49CD|nr:retention module-containing protein [Buttiauxella sp. A2-C1_F]MCE0847361.1 retention module-containing protein [Buttiauxella sp. A2-C1_F]